MSKQFVVKVYTPKGLVLEKSTEFLRLPGKAGDVGIFCDHTPSLIECIEGEMVLRTANHTHAFFLPDAIAHVAKDDVVLIVDHLEPIENIDKKRASASKDRALERLDRVGQSLDIDVDRAKRSLNRAELRLEILLKHQIN
jgi:F-type H+-transporting ATPase subunit epsilon